MERDLEKLETIASHHLPQDIDGPVEHPGVSTLRDGEETDQIQDTDVDIDSSDSIHSHSILQPTNLSHSHSITANGAIIDGGRLEKVRSTGRSSTRSRQLVIVPKGERRGLLAWLSLLPEVEKPHDYKNGTKWWITFVVALAGAAAPVGSAIMMPALPEMAIDLNANTTITNLSVAMYMLSMAIFPLWWSSFSETLGRRTIYMTSFFLFSIWNIASALSTSISMLIIMRVLGGGAAASVQAVGAGTIADIWEVRERGKAMGIFYLGPLLGPLLAPIVGGVLSEKWGWRSTQWFQVIYGGLLLIILTLCLPETLARKLPPTLTASSTLPLDEKGHPITRITTRQSVTIKTKTAARYFKRCIIDPLSVLAFLRFPAVLITVYLASVTFGSLYVLNISIQQTFSRPPYDYTVSILGLLYIPNSIGYIIASILGGRWVDYIMHREARLANRYDSSGKLIFRPEDRMRENAWLSAIIYPGALIWYGWTADKGLPWIAPMLANFFFGLGSMIIFGLVTTMLTEFMPKRSSSGVAVNNFVRNIFGCVGGIVAQPLIGVLGNGWLFTGLGVICWVSSFVIIWAMRRFGPRWRVVMDQKLNIVS